MLQQLHQQRRLQVLGHRIERMADRGGGATLSTCTVAGSRRISRARPRISAAWWRKTAWSDAGRQVFQNPANIRQKPHIKHLVGLVQHQQFQVSQVNRAWLI